MSSFLQRCRAGPRSPRTARNIFLVAGFAVLIAAWPAAAQTSTDADNTAGQQKTAGKAAGSQAPITSKPFTPLTGSQKWHLYWKSYYDPRAIFAAAASAGLSQANDSVTEWGQGAAGYGRRLGNAYGKHVVRSSISIGLDGLIGYDPRYWPSERHGFRNRLLDSVSQMFRTRDDTGRWRIAYPTFASAFGSGFISRAWYPSGERGALDALKSGAASFGVDAAVTVLKEFVRLAR